MMALLDDLLSDLDIERMADGIKAYVLDLWSQGAVGLLIILRDWINYQDETYFGKLSSSLCTAVDIILIVLILKNDAGALARPEAKLTAFPGWLLPCCCDISLYLPGPCASSRGAL